MDCKKLNVKNIASLLCSRAVIVVLLITLQAVFLLGVAIFYSSVYMYVYWTSVVLSFLMVLIIISRNTDPGYKIGWIIPILLFPMFGWIIYLICGGNRVTKRMRRKLQGVNNKTKQELERDCKAEMLASFGEDAVNQARYLENIAGCPVYTNTYTEYFPLGDDLFPRMLEELKKAEKYIFIEYFIIEEGTFWNSILEVLKEKLAAGVDVRILYDDVGCLRTLPMNYCKKLEEETGIPCCVFNRFKPVLSIRMNNRDHRKFCIIDGHTAFTGGINLADEYINRKVRFGHWKDTAIMVKGEAAWSITVMFLGMWEYNRGTDENFSKFRPASLPPEAELGRRWFVQPYADDPLDNEPVGETVYLNLISKAKRYIYLMTPYLVVSDSVNTALCNASKAGVDVRLITPHIPDKKFVFELTRAHYEPLLAAGVKIYEYTPGFVHAKTCVADDRYATVGTINLDYRSMFLHFEDGVLLFGDPVIQEIKEDFFRTLAKSQEVTLADCRRLSRGRTLMRSILRVMAPLL